MFRRQEKSADNCYYVLKNKHKNEVLEIMNKYLVKKQFAHNSDIFNVNDIVEMSDVDAKSFVDAGKLVAHTEEKQINVKAEVNSKEIGDAVAKAMSALIPAQKQVEKKLGYGEYLSRIAKGESADKMDRKTINITTNTQGNYALETDTDPVIDADLLKASNIANKATVINLTSTDIWKKNVLNSMGNAPAVFAESATINASQPTITQFTFTPEKVCYRYDATEEALQDVMTVVQEVGRQAPEEFSKFIENGMLNGSGTCLTAIVGHAQTVVTPYVSLQTAGTINYQNVVDMVVRCKNPERSQWVMSRSCWAQVLRLEDDNGNRVWEGGVAGAPAGTLFGMPIVLSDKCQAVGTVGDIVLGDFSKYYIASKGGLKLASSAHVKFLTAETVFIFSWRLDGQPIGLKLTSTDAVEVGDFVVLDDRLGST